MLLCFVNSPQPTQRVCRLARDHHQKSVRARPIRFLFAYNIFLFYLFELERNHFHLSTHEEQNLIT